MAALAGWQAGKARGRHPRAAIAQFALKGWCGTSVEAKGKRAGVTQPHLSRPFPTKKAIVAAALTRSREDAHQACESVPKG
ncbi:helix-turn-helix domain-containing protein [Streptomyces europaeiscabiei]|uniref:helix-turn-helix domain-containing protein n=1 Tax=Streptomyces europaeiscabiei TaxID=146819 RepID=UPI0038F6C6D4